MSRSRRLSVLAVDGHEVASLELPAEAAVRELQEHISEVSGLSPAVQRLVHAGKVLPPDATLEAAGVENGAQLTLVVTFAVVEYRVLQGFVLKKPGPEPATPKIVRWDRKVGSTVRTTGQVWTGPAGGEWVEVDPSAEKAGWLLIEGPGLGVRGPLLEEVVPGEEAPYLLQVRSPSDNTDCRDICLRPSWTLWQAKVWISLRLPGLNPEKMVIVKKRPVGRSARFTPAAWILPNTSRVEETEVKDGDEILYLYLGDSSDYAGGDEGGG